MSISEVLWILIRFLRTPNTDVSVYKQYMDIFDIYQELVAG